jgi:hypothetical protein
MTIGRPRSRNIESLEVNQNEEIQRRAKDVKADERFIARMRVAGKMHIERVTEGVNKKPGTEHPTAHARGSNHGLRSSGGDW